MLVAYSLNWLPGSTYTLLKSSTIIFHVILILVVRRKKNSVTRYHILAVAFICCGPVFLALGGNQVRHVILLEVDLSVLRSRIFLIISLVL